MRVDEKKLAKIQKFMLIAVVFLLSSILVTNFFFNGVMIKTSNGDLLKENSSKNSFNSYDISNEMDSETPETTSSNTDGEIPEAENFDNIVPPVTVAETVPESKPAVSVQTPVAVPAAAAAPASPAVPATKAP